MPWCPHCKTEYREGVSVCADCGATLVEALPPTGEEAVPVRCNEQPLRPVLLAAALDDAGVSLAEQLLRQAGIPVWRRDREAGGYLRIVMGSSVYGSDLYVDEEQLEAARAVLADGFPIMEEIEPDEELEAEAQHRRGFSRLMSLLLAAALICGLLAGGIAALHSLLSA